MFFFKKAIPIFMCAIVMLFWAPAIYADEHQNNEQAFNQWIDGLITDTGFIIVLGAKDTLTLVTIYLYKGWIETPEDWRDASIKRLLCWAWYESKSAKIINVRIMVDKTVSPDKPFVFVHELVLETFVEAGDCAIGDEENN